jgi:hypothetical protein
MTTGLLNEIAQGVIRPLEKALESPETPLSVGRARELLRGCLLCAQALDQIHQVGETLLDEGAEVTVYRVHLENTASLAEYLRQLFGRLAATVRDLSPDFNGKADGLAAVEKAVRKAEAYRDEVAPLLEWASKPMPPLPPEVVARLDEPTASGEWVTHEELTRESGGA